MSLWSLLLINDLCGKGPPTVVSGTPGHGVLGCMRKQVEQTSKHHSLMSSVSVLAFKFPPWVLAMISLQGWTISCKMK